MLALNMAEQVLMLYENAAELTSGLQLLQAVLLCVHPEHVLLEGIWQKLALAKIALHFCLGSFGMLGVKVIRH